MELPNVLILNQPFVSNTGGGITLSNLFKGWDKEKLAVACSGYIMTPDIDPTICDNYYQLGSVERSWVFPFNLFGRKYPSGPINFKNKSIKKVVTDESKSKTRVGFVMKYLNPFLNYTGLTHSISKTSLSPKFIQWVENFNPDIIYIQCSSRESILFCNEVQNYFKKPTAFHMMDDWPSVISNKGIFKNYWTKKIDAEFKILLKGVNTPMAICDYMGEEYKKRYGKDFITFHNPININFWATGQKKEYTLQENPTIMYAGRIGLGIDKSLQSIAKAVEIVNSKLNISLNFIIQAQKSPEWVSNYDCVNYQSFVPYDELPKVFGRTDFLILPYDFSPKSIAYIKYSMPTKASEYMTSGAPILIFAPDETALVQYAKNKKWASVITENNKNLLAETLVDLITNKEKREKIANNAKELANIRHDDQVVTAEFRDALISTSKM
ncbi:glycosyltransferase [uncultured Maribacter sp.]|uniref:glycosyltransferase n=1 Tax=uncultured Maribacter sp. TaxID=431308 RepID=UPI002634EBCC|nr:glycosyltransferase [uncultured Maribacter sp.]